MRFNVPQFLEYETKLVGPLTVRQTLFIIIPGGVCFLLYLAYAKTNFPLFFFPSLIIMGIGLSLAFVRVAGQNLPTFLINFFKFNLTSKTYLWKKPASPIMTVVFKRGGEKKEEEKSALKIPEGDRLKKIRIQLETKTK